MISRRQLQSIRSNKLYKPTELLFAQLSICEFPLFYNVKSSNKEAGKALYKSTPLLSAYVGTIVSALIVLHHFF